jgi:transcriptional regulator with XRE-family HTH domain
MTRNTPGKLGLPLSLRQKIAKVGRQIKLARKRRGLTMQDMADRMFVTRKTLYRLEAGDPGVSVAILASALLTLGLESDLDHLADPESDITGKLMDRRSHDQRQRIRPSPKIDMDF